MKPTLALDADLDLVRFPCWVQPKIDGVRAIHFNGQLTGRSLDPFAGYKITELWSRPEFEGLDGEMIEGPLPNCTDRLCARTTGAMGRFKDVQLLPDLYWYVFDLVTPETVSLPYHLRWDKLILKVEELNHRFKRIQVVETRQIDRIQQLERAMTEYAVMGYEGTIIRNPNAPHKEGRATKKNQELLRVKPWTDSEILVTGLTQGNKNGNERTENSLGRGERSSAKAGLIPNGQVGSIQGYLLENVMHPIEDKILFPKGRMVTVSSGAMTVKEATHFWEHPEEIVGHIVKFQHMVHGTKDVPRFPTYLSHRLKEDMSREVLETSQPIS